jgi:hypothetical protein
MNKHIRHVLLCGLLAATAFPAAAFSSRPVERYVEAPRPKSDAAEAKSEKDRSKAKPPKRAVDDAEKSRLAWQNVLGWLGLEGLRG